MLNDQKKRTLGAAAVLLQGAVTALFPQLSAKFAKKMISKNFHNSDELEAKSTYLRKLRAIGVGTVAAAGTSLLLQDISETDSDPEQASESSDS